MTDIREEEQKLLRELVNLTRVSVYPAAKKTMEDQFFEEDGTPRRKRVRVYANLDGRTQEEIAKAAGAGQSSVSEWKQEWERFGLVGHEGRAVFDIYAFFPGLEEQVNE